MCVLLRVIVLPLCDFDDGSNFYLMKRFFKGITLQKTCRIHIDRYGCTHIVIYKEQTQQNENKEAKQEISNT